MRILLVALVLFTLGGCASLAPTAVNPALTCINNDAMAIVAAANGDCSVPLCAQSANVALACANLPATATVTDNATAFQTCLTTGAGATTGQRIGTAAAKIKAATCAALPAPAPTPAKTGS